MRNSTTKSTKFTKKHKGILMILCALCVFVVNFPTAAQTQATITPLSVDSEGKMGNAGSGFVSISSDGRFVAFVSNANNLVKNDTNDSADVFLHDRLTGKTARVSLSPAGDEIKNPSSDPVLSPEGRFILFKSLADKLDDAESNNTNGPFFVHDLATQKTSPLLININGKEVNPALENISISGDGRYIAFSSAEDFFVRNDHNNVSDVFIYDRLTENLMQASVNREDEVGNASSKCPILSEDGRSVAFISEASNLVLGDTNGATDIFLYNRVLGQTERIPIPSNENQRNGCPTFPTLSSDGRTIAFLSTANKLPQLAVYDRQNGTTTLIETPPLSTIFRISGDGKYLALGSRRENGIFDLYRHQLETGIDELIAEDVEDASVSISADGNVIAFVKKVDGIDQVFVWDGRGEMLPSYMVTGQVTDASGYPLALVTLEDGRGNTVRSDGEGYFWINGITPGSVTLLPSKEGFIFEPEKVNLDVQSDLQGIHFIYAHDAVLSEAQKDLGMPYSFERGSGGPFHGFSAGYCTDLILDAYTWGVDFSIQFALEQDFRAHPWHFYRWRDARNAHDMWRYFSYSGQMLPHEAPYQPGDMVFFDWSEDGEIDHVSIVSEVSHGRRPSKLYDATGVIEGNPSGLAAELSWETFHEGTVRGHARWSGKYEPVIPRLPPGEVLQVALGGPGVNIRLLDAQGSAISMDEDEIPAGRFDDLVWEQSISVTDLFVDGSYYLVVIYNPQAVEAPYQFIAQILQDGLVTGRVASKGSLGPGEFGRFPLLLKMSEDGDITLQLRQSQRRIEGVLR